MRISLLVLTMLSLAVGAFAAEPAKRSKSKAAKASMARVLEIEPGVIGLIASVRCTHSGGRCSGDFTTENPPAGTNYMEFLVEQDNRWNNTIVFDVTADRRFFPDKRIFTGVKSGDTIPYAKHRKIYIENPDGAGRNQFTVFVVAREKYPQTPSKSKAKKSRR